MGGDGWVMWLENQITEQLCQHGTPEGVCCPQLGDTTDTTRLYGKIWTEEAKNGRARSNKSDAAPKSR